MQFRSRGYGLFEDLEIAVDHIARSVANDKVKVIGDDGKVHAMIEVGLLKITLHDPDTGETVEAFAVPQDASEGRTLQ